MSCCTVIKLNNNFKLEKKTYLYSFDSSFAEVSLHLNVDLYIANIAEDMRAKTSYIQSCNSCNTEMIVTLKSKEEWINIHLIYRSSRTCPLSFSVCALIPTTFMACIKREHICSHNINAKNHLCETNIIAEL